MGLRERMSSGRARTPLLAALYLVGAAAPRFAAFLLLPVYAFDLTPAELAAYGIAVSLAYIIGIVGDLGVLDGMGITYFDQPDDEKAAFLKTVAVLSRVLAVVVLVPIGILLAVFWDPLFGDGLSLWPGLALVLGFAFLQRGNTLAGGIHRLRDNHGRFAATKLVPAVVQVLAGLLYVFVLHWGAAGAIAAAPTGFLVSILWASAGGGGRHVPFARLPRETYVRIVTRGLPVLPESLAKWAQLLALRPLLQLGSTIDQTARFTFAGAFAQVVSPVTEAFEQYLFPKYYRGCATDDTEAVTRANELTSLFSAVAAVGGILGIVVLDPLFRAFAPAPYVDTAGIAAIGLAGILLRSPMSLMVHNLRTCDRRLALVLSVVVGVVVSLAGFFLLVGSLGAVAAAISVYLYPAASCAFMLAVLRDGRYRLVDVPDFLLTNGAVMVTLLTMLWVTDHQSAASWSTLAVVAAVTAAVVGLVAVRHRHVALAMLGRGARA